ncbi:MAG: glycosyltransferase [Candidatus Micrarchaeaceae archaeon]
MKALIYSTYKGMFLENIIYNGFSTLLGKNSAYLYKPQNCNLAVTDPAFVNAKNIVKYSDINSEIDNFDYIFFFNSAFLDDNFHEILNKRTSAKKIFIDGIDDFFIRKIYKHPEISYYFKRELYNTTMPTPKKLEWGFRYVYELTRTPGTKGKRKKWFSYWNMPIAVAHKSKFKDILPLPLTVANPPEHVNNHSRRKYTISFIGHDNNPERIYYLNRLKKYLDENKINGFLSTKIVSKKKYINTIKDSKIGLSTRGTGYDTWRYWEIPCYGSTLLAQKSPILIPNNFIDEESALFFSNFDELKQKLKKYVIKSDEWQEIARNGNKWFLKYHTPRVRAKNMLEIMRD